MQTTIFSVFLALILAYTVGEFVLHREWISTAYRGGAQRVASMAAHYVLGVLCVALFTRLQPFSLRSQTGLLGLACLYALLDLKRDRSSESMGKLLLVQCLCLLGVGTVTALLIPQPPQDLQVLHDWFVAVRQKILVTAVVYAVVVFAGGYLIRAFIQLRFTDKKASPKVASSAKAGMYIGWVERFLILTACYAGPLRPWG